MQPDRLISQLLTTQPIVRSLEFFPPKDEAGLLTLRQTATSLQRIAPDFVSVTYGAGGTTRDRTAQASAMLKNEFGFTVMPHLTCVGHSRAELGAAADQLHQAGFRNIMTLRGDPPKGDTEFRPAPDGLSHASELVQLLKSRHADFCLGVAGYPEKHPESLSLEVDLGHLRRKVDAGAAFITTQLFSITPFTIDSSRNAGPRELRCPLCLGSCPCFRSNRYAASRKCVARTSHPNSSLDSKSPPKIPTWLK